MDGPISLNGVLAALAPVDRERLKPDLALIDLPVRYRLAEVGKPIGGVYFLISGIASTVGRARREAPIEIGVTGREGFVSLPVVLGADRSPNEVYMQVPGAGLRIDADRLREAVADSASLGTVLLRFVHIFMLQTGSTVVANGRGSLEARLGRWLLMAYDRVDGDDVPLTHEFLSMMLGVRRAGVTIALREFERRAMIGRRRGTVVVLDRAALEEVADGYYGAAEDEYERLFGRVLRRA